MKPSGTAEDRWSAGVRWVAENWGWSGRLLVTVLLVIVPVVVGLFSVLPVGVIWLFFASPLLLRSIWRTVPTSDAQRHSNGQVLVRDLFGLVLIVPVLTILCVGTLGYVFPPAEQGLDRCEARVYERGLRVEGSGIHGMRWTPGYVCNVDHSEGTVTTAERRWIGWFVHLITIAGSIALLAFLLSRFLFMWVVGAGTLLYALLTALVAFRTFGIYTITGLLCTGMGVAGMVMRAKRDGVPQRPKPDKSWEMNST